MPTNDERREVARRMRAFSERFGCISILHLACAIGVEKSDAESIYGRLADLIEPNQDKIGTCPENVLKASGIDRDALLALASDIDKQTDGSMFDAWLEDGHYIARRIREAVGA
ncbi:MAG: hypothetical protein U0M51_04290 [Eggerthellaceae bacterium]